MNSLRSALLIFAVTLVVSQSIAHEQKTALTEISYNERTGRLEIVHRIRVHDAEHALRKATGATGDLTKSGKTQAAFAKYVVERFGLKSADKTELKLTLVGQELERGYFWVYQEMKLTKPVGMSFLIENSILQDTIKEQVNTVNVRLGSGVSTLIFKSADRAKLYSPRKETE